MPSEWKVHTVGRARESSLISEPSRDSISRAALLVNVIAAIDSGAWPAPISPAILWVITRVLPLPAPAITRHGPSR